MTKRSNRPSAKSAWLRVRVTAYMRAWLEKAATLNGITLSDEVRRNLRIAYELTRTRPD